MTEYHKGYQDGYKDCKAEMNEKSVLDKIRAEISKSKTKHEMQIAENNIKAKLLISDIYCDIVNIIDRNRG